MDTMHEPKGAEHGEELTTTIFEVHADETDQGQVWVTTTSIESDEAFPVPVELFTDVGVSLDVGTQFSAKIDLAADPQSGPVTLTGVEAIPQIEAHDTIESLGA